MKIQEVFIALFCLLVLAAPLLAFAHTSPWNPAALRVPLLTCNQQQQVEKNPDGTLKKIVPCSWGELFHTVTHVITFALALLFYGIAPTLFVWGGIKILTSGSSPEGMSDGKRIITGTLMAILIALLSYWLVKFVVTTVAPGEMSKMGL